MPGLAAAVLGVVLLDQHVLAAGAEPSALRSAAGTAAVLVAAAALAALASAFLPREACMVLAATLALLLAAPAARTGILRGAEPLRIGTSAVVLAAAVLATHETGAAATLARATATGAGFVLASAALAAIGERLRDADGPRSFRGAAIAAVTVAIACLALAGVAGP